MTLETPVLPPECKGHILSFLGLEDVLRFASTGKIALKDTLPDLHRRRESMKKNLAYCPTWKTQSNKTEPFGLWDVMTEKHPEIEWIMIPSVYDRVCELYKHIPSGHPMVNTICHLKEDLSQNVSLDGIAQALISFPDLVHLYQRLLSAQKMHSAVLHYVMHSNPMEKNTAVNLDQYIGDVLCVAYLINQSSLGLVEGGPSNRTLLRDTRQPSTQKSCYLSWVYLHSSILRVKSFTTAQRHRLGIPEFSGLSEMVPNDHYINDAFLSSEMTLIFREFGPLGPAFRGRDIVRMHEIPAQRLFAFMISNDRAVRGATAFHA